MARRRSLALALTAAAGIPAVLILVTLTRPTAPSGGIPASPSGSLTAALPSRAPKSSYVIPLATASLSTTEPAATPETTEPLPSSTATQEPSPTQSISPAPSATPIPTPPTAFHLAEFRLAGDFPPTEAGTNGVWTFGIDSSQRTRWTSSRTASPIGLIPDGVAWIDRHHGPGRLELWVGRKGHLPRLLGTDLAYPPPVVRAGAVYATRFNGESETGLWRIPLDGSTPVRVLPPFEAATRDSILISLAVSPTGDAFARRFERGDVESGVSEDSITQIGSGGLVWTVHIGRASEINGEVLRYRTVANRGVGLYNLRTRSDLTIRIPYGNVALIRHGRQLLGYKGDTLTLVDVASGKRRTIPIPDPRFFDGWLTGIGTDRFAVLGRFVLANDTDRTELLVVDLRTGWSRAYPRVEP